MEKSDRLPSARIPDFARLFLLDGLTVGSDDSSTEHWFTPRLALRLWLSIKMQLANLAIVDTHAGPDDRTGRMAKLVGVYGRVGLAKALEALLGDLEEGNEPFPRSKAEFDALRLAISDAETLAGRGNGEQIDDITEIMAALPVGRADRQSNGGTDLTDLFDKLTINLDVSGDSEEVIPS